MEDQRPAEGQQVTLAEALAFAIENHRHGNLELADEIYTQVLKAFPEQPDALHFRGVLLHQVGKSDEAIGLMRRAAQLQPDHPDFHINLGNVLTSLGQCNEALQAYERALALRPASADAHCNRGVVLRALHRDREAEAAYRTAIERDAEHAGAFHNLGNLLNDTRRPAEACEAYEKALSLKEGFSEAFQLLAKTQYRMGQRDAAIGTLRRWLSVSPEDPIARHLLAACEGRDIPSRAGDDYVRELFDDFANSFDTILQRLHYRAPQLVGDALALVIEGQNRELDVLDAGCGTGLAAPMLRGYARRLIGVDLSPRMLDKARRTGLYDDLVEQELTAYLTGHPDRFNLIASADTLCYFGDLSDVLRSASTALRPAGLFIFTVEKADPEEAPQGYLLRYHGRYSHTRSYVEQQLDAAGLTPSNITEAVLRRECGQPVHGLTVTVRAAPAPSA